MILRAGKCVSFELKWTLLGVNDPITQSRTFRILDFEILQHLDEQAVADIRLDQWPPDTGNAEPFDCHRTQQGPVVSINVWR